MTRTMLNARLRALAREERGFTLVETMIAITIVFGAIVALGYTASLGFKSTAYASERVTADGAADQIMETIRGQAFSRIQAGLSTSDLTDSNIVSGCAGDGAGIYRFETCSGEKIVTSGGVPSTPWINPHTGTIAASAATNYVAYSWSTYITNNCPAVSGGCTSMDPYRVTVIVRWASKAHPNNANSYVRIQSLFSSPSGCLSSSTHPFAAPCQPSFYGFAKVPSGRVDISGSVQGTTFSSGFLGLTGTESNLQSEQVTQGRASFTESEVSVTDGAGTRTDAGTLTTTSAADSDPGAPAATYGTASVASGSGGSVSSASGLTSIDFTAPPGDSGAARAAVSAGGTNVCPPPSDPAETDSLPCVGARIQQGGSLSSSLTLNGIVSGLGTVALADVGAASNSPNVSFVNKEAVANQDGSVAVSATRRVGTVKIGDFPTGLTTPSGWSSSNYLLKVSGYEDAVKSQAGSTTTAAPSAPAPAGTITYWNGSGYSVASPGSASLSALDCPSTTASATGTIGGHSVTTTICVSSSQAASVGTTSTCSPVGSLTQCTAENSSVSPVAATVHYVVTVDGATTVDLSIAVNLGTLLTRSVYGPAPAAG